MPDTRQSQERFVQWATLLSVVVGVVLVVYELRQTREMTLTQLVHETITQIQDERIARYGENLGDVLATACLKPKELSPGESFVLDAYFNTQIAIVNRYLIQQRIGGFETDWEGLGRPAVLRVLAFPQGRTWLRKHPLWMSSGVPPELREYLVERIEDDADTHCTETVARLTRLDA